MGTSCSPNSLALRCQGFQRPLFKLIVVLFLADVGIVEPTLQHSVDQERQFVCRGDDALRFSDAGTEAATKSAKCALAAKQALGAQAKNGSSAADRFSCSAFEDTASTDFVIGAQAEPRHEVFFGRPRTHPFILNRGSLATGVLRKVAFVNKG